MSTQTMPLAIGDRLPNSPLVSSTGKTTGLHDELAGEATIVFYMRSASCPVCNAHVRTLGREARAGAYGDAAVLVVVPGGADKAAAIDKRYAGNPITVRASDSAHEEAGLFVKMGLQQSGTYVADARGTVSLARIATVPTGGFDHAEVVDHIAQKAPQARA